VVGKLVGSTVCIREQSNCGPALSSLAYTCDTGWTPYIAQRSLFLSHAVQDVTRYLVFVPPNADPAEEFVPSSRVQNTSPALLES
jgi:hypothetical protein